MSKRQRVSGKNRRTGFNQLPFQQLGPIIATAIAALAPPASTFKRGRDFAV